MRAWNAATACAPSHPAARTLALAEAVRPGHHREVTATWLTVACWAVAAPSPGATDIDAQYDALARLQGGPVRVAAEAETPATALPEVAPAPVVELATIRAVVTRERASLWACRDALGPQRRFVLDLAVGTNGRVRELRLRPGAPPPLEACLRRAALRWRFPRFSGERPDGRTVEVVNASLPLRFQE